MSKLDKKREKIGLLKFWLGVCVGSWLAIAGWLATNIAAVSLLLAFLSVGCLLCLFIIGFLLSRRINQHIDDLEDL